MFFALFLLTFQLDCAKAYFLCALFEVYAKKQLNHSTGTRSALEGL